MRLTGRAGRVPIVGRGCSTRRQERDAGTRLPVHPVHMAAQVCIAGRFMHICADAFIR